MDEKTSADIFKRFPLNRISPIKEVNTQNGSYLKEFFEEMVSLDSSKINLRRFQRAHYEAVGLHGVLDQIALISSRINEDIDRTNGIEELFHKVTIGERLTETEMRELDKSPTNVEYLCLDIVSVLIFVNIFMDKLARFLGQLIEADKVQTKNFDSFRKGLRKLKNDRVSQLLLLLDEETKWFDDFKAMRDDFVVHHPGAGRALKFLGDKPFVVLTTAKGTDKEPKEILMNSVAKSIPIENIDEVLKRLQNLLKNLNVFLCDNLKYLPIQVKRKRTSRV